MHLVTRRRDTRKDEGSGREKYIGERYVGKKTVNVIFTNSLNENQFPKTINYSSKFLKEGPDLPIVNYLLRKTDPS